MIYQDDDDDEDDGSIKTNYLIFISRLHPFHQHPSSSANKLKDDSLPKAKAPASSHGSSISRQPGEDGFPPPPPT